MLEVIGVVEHGVDLRITESHLRVFLEISRKLAGTVAAHFPDLHGVALHGGIAVLAAIAGLGQRQQHALRIVQAAEQVEVFPHVLGIDHQLVDDAGQPGEREVEGHGRVGADHALHRGVRNIALVPEGDVFQRRGHHAAHEAGEAGEVFGQHRIALVRHGRRALLAGGEELLGLEHFGALQVADFDGHALDGTGDDAERGKEHGVAIARNHLGRDRLDG
ncbi:hypothetical protein D3C87_1569410 [compost metagenome]